MEKSIVIIGLSRQAQIAFLPMPYALAVISITIMPFIWLEIVWWLPTILIWWSLAKLFTMINPNGHRVLNVRLKKSTFSQLIKKKVVYGA